MDLSTLDHYLKYISKSDCILGYKIPTDMDREQYKSEYGEKLLSCKSKDIESMNLLFGNSIFKLESTSYGILNMVVHRFDTKITHWLSYDHYEVSCILRNPCVYVNTEYTFRDLYNKSIALEVWDYGNRSRFKYIDIEDITTMDTLPTLLYMKENVPVDLSHI